MQELRFKTYQAHRVSASVNLHIYTVRNTSILNTSIKVQLKQLELAEASLNMFAEPSFKPSMHPFLGAGESPGMRPLFGSPAETNRMDVRGTPAKWPSESTTNKVTHIGDGGIATGDFITSMQFVTPSNIRQENNVQEDADRRLFDLCMHRYFDQCTGGAPLLETADRFSEILDTVDAATIRRYISPAISAPVDIDRQQIDGLKEHVLAFVYNKYDDYRKPRERRYNHAQFYGMAELNNMLCSNNSAMHLALPEVERANTNFTNMAHAEVSMKELCKEAHVEYTASLFVPWGPAITCEKVKLAGQLQSNCTPTYMLNAFVGGSNQRYADIFLWTHSGTSPSPGCHMWLLYMPFKFRDDARDESTKDTTIVVMVVDTGREPTDTDKYELADRPFDLSALKHGNTDECDRFNSYVRREWDRLHKPHVFFDGEKQRGDVDGIRKENACYTKKHPLGIMVEESHRVSNPRHKVAIQAHFNAELMAAMPVLRGSTS